MMMIAASTAFLLMAAQAAPTIAQIDRLSPRAAGALALAGKKHGPVVAVETPPIRGLHPPGLVERDMVEQTLSRPGGCIRTRWRVSFTYKEVAKATSAVMTGASSSTEIALARASKCVRADYVNLDPNLTPTEGYAALAVLDQLRAGRRPVKLSCFDETRSGLCTNDSTIRAELKALKPWAVVWRDGAVQIWSLDQGRSTAVVIADPKSNKVIISRSIPPPA